MATSAMTSGWSLKDAPRLDGKVAIVTGATGGLGFQTALALAELGATTVLAGRNTGRGSDALGRVRRQLPSAKIRFEMLDLASLASIEQFAGTMSNAFAGGLDILVNNAAVMALPRRMLTEDGFERQVGVNYLGHFALTGRLREVLSAASGGGRVITVASLAHRRARLDLDDLQSKKSYVPMRVYASTKLANLIFALELQRRAEARDWNLRSIAVHPGWARTDIIGNGMGMGEPSFRPHVIAVLFGLVAQSAAAGALPSLYAATSPDAKGGAYYGPTRWDEKRGPPGVARIYSRAKDPAVASRLWALSEDLTGVSFG